MSQLFKVASIRNVNWQGSIVRASINLEILPHGIVLKDCLLKEGQYGWFLSSPSKKLKEPFTGKDGKVHEYMDLAFFPKEIRDELNNLCCEAYDPTGNYTNTNTTTTTTATPATGEGHQLADKAQEMFTADDLPA